MQPTFRPRTPCLPTYIHSSKELIGGCDFSGFLFRPSKHYQQWHAAMTCSRLMNQMEFNTCVSWWRNGFGRFLSRSPRAIAKWLRNVTTSLVFLIHFPFDSNAEKLQKALVKGSYY